MPFRISCSVTRVLDVDQMPANGGTSFFMCSSIQIEVFWVVTPCVVVAGHQRFGGPCCPHRWGEVISERLISYHDTTRRHRSQDNDLHLHRRENLETANGFPFFVLGRRCTNWLVSNSLY